MMPFALCLSAMPLLIFPIRLGGPPYEIDQAIVSWISIEMAALLTLRARTHEGSEFQSMNRLAS